MSIQASKGINIKNSCLLVYQSPRYERPNAQCIEGNSNTPTYTAPRNKRKFEMNGCSKVDRDNACKLKMMRG